MALGNAILSTGDGGGGGSNVDTSEIKKLAQDALEAATAAQTKVNGFDSRITAVETSASNSSNQVTELSGTVSKMTNDLNTAVTNAAAAKSTADEAATAAGQATAQIAVVTSTANAAKTAANTAAEQVATFDDRLDKAEKDAADASSNADKALAASGVMTIVNEVPTSLAHSKMTMVGKNLYIGGPNNEVQQVAFVNGGGSSETVTIGEEEVAYISGVVYYGKPGGGVGVLFNGPEDAITVAASIPTTLDVGAMAAVEHDLYVGDIGKTPVKITSCKMPETRPASGAQGTLFIWGERIFYSLSDGSWEQVGIATGLGYGSASDPVLGVPMLGDDYMALGLTWTIVNLTDEWLYLMLKTPSKKTKYGDTAVFEGSTLAAEAAAIEAGWTSAGTSTEKLGTVTIEGVSGKIYPISKERFSQYSYLATAANAVAKMDGVAVGWYLATPGSTSGKVWYVDATGALKECDPTTELAFRPFIAYKRT